MKKISPFFVFPVLCFMFIVMASCGGGDGKTPTTGKKDKYEETKESLAETEKKTPVRFLKATVLKDRKNIWGQTVVKGEVRNNATVATYKDVEVELSFFSKTGTLLEKDIEIVYETIGPGKDVDFKSRYFAPNGTDSVALKVLKAKSE